MSIFTCNLSLFVVAGNKFWTFFSRFAALCPFSLASFHFSWSLAINFGLFSQELLHYVHFRHRHLRFLQYCDLFLDIFASLMLPYVHFHLQTFHFSWSHTMNFGLFSQELLHYVHFRHRHLRFLQYDGLSIQYPTTLICKQLKIFLKLFCHVKSPP